MPDSTVDDAADARYVLTTVAGPSEINTPLVPPGPVTIGRRSSHTIELADKRISRDHLRFMFRPEAKTAAGRDDRWFVTDMGSKHGTWLNGMRLSPGQETPLANDDYLIIGPWTLRIVDHQAAQPVARSVSTVDDASQAQTIVSRVIPREAESLDRQRLALLLDCAEAIHAAADEVALAEAVLDAAAGTGFANAAVLKPMTTEGRIELVACRGEIFDDVAEPRLSRSLIREAASGTPARLQRQGGMPVGAQSIIDLRIEEALCVPILLGSAVGGFLYLDARAGSRLVPSRTAHDATGFALGLARLAGMAMSNLLRLDVQRRHARIEAELNAAAETQRTLMPPRTGRLGPFAYVGETRPGRYVGGDFFDVIPLGEHQFGVAVGDITGKGVAASVLMTASSGFLHAALRQHGNPGQAVTDLNAFLEPRCQDDRFLTLWVGVLDARERCLHYVDAGHGYGMMLMPDGSSQPLDAYCGGLVGIDPDTRYQSQRLDLPEGGRVLVVSDGIIEQPAPGADRYDQFSLEGVQQCLARIPPGADEIAALFTAVEQFAGTTALADDATAVLVRW